MLFLLSTFVLISVSGFASPSSLNYQGRILKSDGTPLESNNVSFLFQVTNPSGNCIIYQEQVTGYSMVNSGGVFDLPIGAGSVQYPLGASSALDAFNNSNSYTCGVCSLVSGSYVCSNGSSTYTASSGDLRKLRVSFYDGSGWKTISPDNVIRSVPFAGYSLSAEKLGTNVATDFLLKAGLPTCGLNTFLSWNGSAFVCNPVSGASGGTVTSITAGTGLSGGTINSSGTIALSDTGVVAGSYGSANKVPSFTVDAQGRISAVNAVTISGAAPGGSASGDLAGNYPAPTVAALQGVSVSAVAPTSGQVLKYNAGNWTASTLNISDVSNLSSTLANYLQQTTFNSFVASANCSISQTMYWNSVSGNFQCQSINVGLAGDVTGSIGAAKVVALQNKNISVTAPANGQVLQWNNGTSQWEPATLPAGNPGTVTNVSANAPLSVVSNSSAPVISISQAGAGANGYLSSADWNTFNNKQAAGNYVTSVTGDVTGSGPGAAATTVAKLQGSTLTITTPANKDYLKYNGTAFVNSPLAAADLAGAIPAVNMPAFGGDVTSSAGTTILSLSAAGTAGTYYKVTTDSKGRVTSGASSLIAADIPVLDWSKITTGIPTTLAGYGITDSLVSNAGGTPSIQTGLDASKPASPAAGAIYFATNTNKIYQYNSGAWVVIASSVGAGGTITSLTGDVSASGSGLVTATVNSVGGSTATNVHNAELAANAATNLNTASTIIKRDASGNFSAGTISANLTGNVTGNVTGLSSLNVLKSGDSMTGNLTFASGKGAVYTDSTTNTVTLQAPTNVTSYVMKWPAAQGGSNQMLTNDGSGNLSWTSLSSLGVSSVSVTAPVTNSGTASAPNIGMAQANGTTNGYLSSADWTAFNSKQSTALPSANILVGNGSGVATAVAASGDVSMTNAGVFTVTAIRGKNVSTTSPSAAGQVLRYDGASTYAPAFLGLADIRATITPFGGVFANAACTATQSLYWQSSTDTFQCQSIAINDGQLSYTVSRAANTFLAAPNGSSGAASYRTIASADLPTSGVTTGTYRSVTVDTYGRVTAGTNPTTVSGYGITDAFVNGGNSFGGAATLGTNDNYSLAFKTNNIARVTVDTSGNVGIGTTAPGSNLEVVDSTGGGSRGLTATTYAANPGGVLQTRGARGTPAAPAALQSGDLYGWLAMTGYDGSSFTMQPFPTGLSAFTTEVWNSTSHGSGLKIMTTPNGAVTATERMRINSNGNVGINTTSPAYPLDVNGGIHASGAIGSEINNTNGILGYLNLTGKNTTSPRPYLSQWSIYNMNNYSGYSGLGFYEYYDADNNGLFCDDAGACNTRMLIVPGGNVGINTNTPATKLHVNGDIAATGWVGAGCEGACDTNGSYALMYADGHAVATVGWQTTSDRRLKTDIVPIENALDKILRLNGVQYHWKRDPAGEKQTGLIAQDVQAIFPDLAKEGKDGFLSLDYSRLAGPLVESIKELYARWNQDSQGLHAEVEKLKLENVQLRAAVCEMNPKAKICESSRSPGSEK